MRPVTFADKDGDGMVSWSEFVDFQNKSKTLLKEDWPLDLNSMRSEFTELDCNGDGEISYSEFSSVMLEQFNNSEDKSVELASEVLEKVIKGYQRSSQVENDRDKKLYLAKMMKKFDEADLDVDGKIDILEFIQKQQQEGDHEILMQGHRSEFKGQAAEGDGRLSREEFRLWAARLYEHM